MSDTYFIDQTTPIQATWLNDVNNYVYHGSAPATKLPASNVSYTPAGTGAVSSDVQTKLRESVSVKDFGAKGDGVTDDTVALNAAFAITGKRVVIPAGTYFYTSNLTPPVCSEIVGEGELVSILKAGAVVTKGLSIGGATYPTYLHGFQILGTLTTNATGLYLGDASSCALLCESVRILNFTGVGAIGLRCGDVLKSKILKVTTSGCYVGCKVYRTTSSFPTTLHFDSCVFTGSTTNGCQVLSGYGIVFTNTDFESSGNEGFYIDSSGGTDAIDIYVGEGCWFEDNWTTLGGTRNTQYHAKVVSNGGVRTYRPIFASCHFSTNNTAGTPLAIYLSGVDVQGFMIKDPRLAVSTTGAFLLDSNCVGRIDEWPTYINYSGAVVDSLGADYGPYGKYHTYTPTFASDIGNQAATFTGAPSITSIRQKQNGRQLLVSFHWTATLLAVTPVYITMTLPSGVTTNFASDAFNSCNISIAGGYVPGMILAAAGTNLIYVRKADNSTFASGAALDVRGQIWLEIL